MTHPHVIRLRGPWEYQPFETIVVDGSGGWRREPQASAVTGKTTVPGDWSQDLGADFRGTVRYTRRFNRPTNLDADEQVWLVLDEVDGTAQVSLNGQALGLLRPPDIAGRYDITQRITPSNVLDLLIELLPAEHPEALARAQSRHGRGGGIVGEVHLEICGVPK